MAVTPIPTVAPRTRLTGQAQVDFLRAAVDLYARGESVRAIAAASGRSYGAVYRALVGAGVELRSRGSRRPAGR
jgi:hypothetical protein